MKWSMCLAHDWNVKSHDKIVTAGFRKCLTGKVFPWDTSEIFCFAILSYLLHYILTHTIYTIITHICWGVFFREKTQPQNLWELEIIIPIILYMIHCGFSQLLPLHFQILERLIAQTLTTPILSVKWDFGDAGKYWKKPFVLWMQSDWIAWSKELEKTRLGEVSW